MFDIFFYPANGVPYDAYAPLLSELSMHRVRSFNYLPLQDPRPKIPSQLSWDDLLPPIDPSTMSSNHVGIGHSLGGTLLLYYALKHPNRWKTIIIVDPALFSPFVNKVYTLICAMNIQTYIHPMIKKTLRRSDRFESKAMIFSRWRQRSLFEYVSDDALHSFIDGCFTHDGRSWALRFPKSWEAAIYESMCTLDPFIWNQLPHLTTKLVVVAGQSSTTFLRGARHTIRPYSDAMIVIPNTTHLLPFEAPVALSKIIQQYV